MAMVRSVETIGALAYLPEVFSRCYLNHFWRFLEQTIRTTKEKLSFMSFQVVFDEESVLPHYRRKQGNACVIRFFGLGNFFFIYISQNIVFIVHGTEWTKHNHLFSSSSSCSFIRLYESVSSLHARQPATPFRSSLAFSLSYTWRSSRPSSRLPRTSSAAEGNLPNLPHGHDHVQGKTNEWDVFD